MTNEGAWLIDLDARIVFANEAACRSLEYSREEMLTMTIFDHDPCFQRSQWDQHIADLKQHGSVKIQTVHRARSGREFPVEVVASFVEFNGAIYNLALVACARTGVACARCWAT